MDDTEKFAISMKVFSSASTYNELIVRYLMYYENKIPYLPTYYGELFTDTIEQLDKIKKINVLGLLTIDSQNGLREVSNDMILNQRSYLEGFIPNGLWFDIQHQLMVSGLVYTANDVVEKSVGDAGRVWVTYSESEEGIEYHTSLALADAGGFEFATIKSWMNEKNNLDPDDFFHLQIMDPIWGRADYLVDKVYEIISRFADV